MSEGALPGIKSTAASQSPLVAGLGFESSRWSDAWGIRSAHFRPEIRFDRPTETLPVSLTGTHCALNCAHCGGHYLKHMQPVWDIRPNGAKSLLISGGCDSDGSVPVGSHLDIVSELKQRYTLNWHVGFISRADLATIQPFIDVVSFDIVGDRETASEVYGLDVGLDDYMATLDLLLEEVPVVPHLTIGLRGGKLSGEFLALEALSTRALQRLILIVLIPTAGTAYADRPPPALSQVASVILQARELLPKTRLYLGCMRPYGTYRRDLDEIAIHAGVNAIVNPTGRAEQVAESLGLRVTWGSECCALR